MIDYRSLRDFADVAATIEKKHGNRRPLLIAAAVGGVVAIGLFGGAAIAWHLLNSDRDPC